jgi:hypothetical protein
LFALLLQACCGTGNANVDTPPAANAGDNNNIARTNVEELALLVNVPYEVEDIVWKPDPALKKVTAVLRFSPVDANKVVAEAEKVGAAENATLAIETWFPAELIAQGDMSGDNALRGLAYPANSFHQEPYTTGRITRIEGSDYFVLELVAK